MKLLLVDGHYYVYRSFFAIRNLSNSRGEATNAIYGFTKTIRRMVKDLRPDIGAVVWDMGLPERRTQLQPEYKQQRAEMPDEMRPQLDYIQRRLAPLLGFRSLGLPGTEADDLIATYAIQAAEKGIEVVIATNDKDLFQLVGDRVKIYSTNKTDLAGPGETFALLDAACVEAKWGVPPSRIGEVLCLTGDASDNIPGVSGFGQKTAAALLTAHDGLDRLLQNLDAVKNERVREKLKSSLDIIAQNREMVKLDLDLPVPAPLEDLQIHPDYPGLIAAMEECEFKSLLQEFKAENPGAAQASAPAPAPEQAPGPEQGELF